jgi:hypothetical protein
MYRNHPVRAVSGSNLGSTLPSRGGPGVSECVLLVLFGAMFLLEPYDYILWSAYWGGGLAISIDLYTVYTLIPRKR